MLRLLAISLFVLSGAAFAADNSFTIKQVKLAPVPAKKKAPSEEDLDKSDSEEEQARQDAPIMIQQGQSNIGNLTEAGRINSVITSGAIQAPSAAAPTEPYEPGPQPIVTGR